MTVGSGLGASIGFGQETSYGTYAAPTRWLAFESESLNVKRDFSKSTGLVSGNLVPLAQENVLLTQSVDGNIKMPVPVSGFGLILKNALGSTATPVENGTSGSYTQTHTVGGTVGDSLTVQIGRPLTTGVVVPYTYLGCKVTGLDIELESGNLAMATVDIVGQTMVTTQTLVTPVYSSTNPMVFSFTGGAIKASTTVGSETTIANVKKASVSLKRKLDTSRFYIGGSGLLAEPIEDDFLECTGSLTTDLTDTTDWDSWVNSGAQLSVILNLVGNQIATGYSYELSIALPVVRIEGDDPKVNGAKIVERDVKFTTLNDLVHTPITYTYTSIDTTL